MREASAKVIADYQLKETLQETFEGVVCRAVGRTSHRHVLIKKYYPSLVWSEQLLEEFLARVDYLRFLEHEYLLEIVDVGQHEGIPYLVYEDSGLTLLRKYEAGKAEPSEVLEFLQMVALALDFLHKQEIVHGTLGVDNIALDQDRIPKIFDYGLDSLFKKVLQENMDEGFRNLSISQAACTSTEQILGLPPSQRSDIYALGIVGYYYIFGKLPFDKQDVLEIFFSKGVLYTKHVLKLPDSRFAPLLRLIEKCIQIKPEDRFVDISQILRILSRMMENRKVYFRFKNRFFIEKRVPQPRARQLYLAGFILLLSIGASLYWLTYHQIPTPTKLPTSPTASLPTPSKQGTSTKETQITAVPTEQVQLPSVGNTPESNLSSSLYQPAIENEKPALSDQPITLNNVFNLIELSRLGYGKPEDLAASPDGHWLAIATSAGVYIFSDNQYHSWIDPQGWATSVQFSEDGDMLAIGLASGDIQLWNWRNRNKVHTLMGHTDKVNRILFSPNFLYSASSDRSIIVWDFKTYEQVHRIPAHSRPVNDIAVNSDGRIIISCSEDGLIRVWDAQSGKQLRQFPFDEKGNKAKAVAITSDDQYFAAGGESGYIRQWDLTALLSASSSSAELRVSSIPTAKVIWSLQYSNNDTELLAGLWDNDGAQAVGYDPTRSGYENFTIDPPAKYLKDIFGAGFDFSSTAIFYGNRIVGISWDGAVRYQASELLNTMYDIVDRVDISQDSTILAVGGRRKTTKIWNLTNNQSIYHGLFELPYGNPISPDGSSVALIVPKTVRVSRTTGNETPLYIYQMKQLASPQGTRDFSEAIPNATVSYARQGTVFVAGNLEKSKVWDFASGYETYSEAERSNKGCRLTVSRNSSEVLQVYSPLGTFMTWKEPAASKLCQMVFQYGDSVSAFSHTLDLFVYINSLGLLEGYSLTDNQAVWQYPLKDGVTALSVSPDGKILVLGDRKGELNLINGENGQLMKEILGNFGIIRAIEFSDNGKLLVTSGDDGTVRVFGIGNEN